MGSVGSTLGLWLIGARGAVATTVAVALAALRRGARPLGLVSAAEPLARAPFVPLDGLVIGGHDVRDLPLPQAARALCRDAGPLDAELVGAVGADLEEVERRLRPAPVETDRRAFVRSVQADLEAFARDTGVGRVVVVNLATTEPPLPADPRHADPRLIEGACELPPSVLYAWAALAAGHPYVNFTPSPGASLPGLDALARERGVPHAGSDGKTGETLLRSALAPMFRMRQLHVLSWNGFNVLGNSDGRALADPDVARSKTASKSGVVPRILGYEPEGVVRIDYVPSIGDWKTAWDLVQFEGILGTRMSLELTWRGSDSALAAPLVLDLARLVDLAARRGEKGALGHLGFFFKSPLGCPVDDLASQYDLLCEHVRCG